MSYLINSLAFSCDSLRIEPSLLIESKLRLKTILLTIYLDYYTVYIFIYDRIYENGANKLKVRSFFTW